VETKRLSAIFSSSDDKSPQLLVQTGDRRSSSKNGFWISAPQSLLALATWRTPGACHGLLFDTVLADASHQRLAQEALRTICQFADSSFFLSPGSTCSHAELPSPVMSSFTSGWRHLSPYRHISPARSFPCPVVGRTDRTDSIIASLIDLTLEPYEYTFLPRVPRSVPSDTHPVVETPPFNRNLALHLQFFFSPPSRSDVLPSSLERYLWPHLVCFFAFTF